MKRLAEKKMLKTKQRIEYILSDTRKMCNAMKIQTA